MPVDDLLKGNIGQFFFLILIESISDVFDIELDF